jgi:hypothetical protein
MPDANPIPKVTPLTGTTTIDTNLVFEPERLTYVSARQIAERISEEIVKECHDVSREEPIVVVSISFLTDLGNLESTGLLLDALFQDYQTLAQRAESRNLGRGGGPARALNILSSVPGTAVLGAGINVLSAGTSLVAGLNRRARSGEPVPGGCVFLRSENGG